jgi:hypothetical protein
MACPWPRYTRLKVSGRLWRAGTGPKWTLTDGQDRGGWEWRVGGKGMHSIRARVTRALALGLVAFVTSGCDKLHAYQGRVVAVDGGTPAGIYFVPRESLWTNATPVPGARVTFRYEFNRDGSPKRERDLGSCITDSAGRFLRPSLVGPHVEQNYEVVARGFRREDRTLRNRTGRDTVCLLVRLASESRMGQGGR